jgi:hypothetical protein
LPTGDYRSDLLPLWLARFQVLLLQQLSESRTRPWRRGDDRHGEAVGVGRCPELLTQALGLRRSELFEAAANVPLAAIVVAVTLFSDTFSG